MLEASVSLDLLDLWPGAWLPCNVQARLYADNRKFSMACRSMASKQLILPMQVFQALVPSASLP